jgi:ATP-dependent Clp protease, protease subunit
VHPRPVPESLRAFRRLPAADGTPPPSAHSATTSTGRPATALYEALRSHAGRVTVYIDGLAGSIASVIAMTGDDVVIAPSEMIFVHDALR